MHEEDALGKAYDARLMKRLLKYLKPYKRLVAVGLLLTLILAGLDLIPPILMSRAIGGPIASGAGAADKAPYLHELMLLAGVFLTVILVSFLLRYLQNFSLNLMGQRAMLDLRGQLFRHLENMDVSFHTKNPVGRLVTRVTNDIEALNELFSSGIITVFGDLFIIVGVTAVLFVVSWKLTFIALSVGPALAIVSILFRRKIRRTYRETRVRIARINAYLQENIAGMRVIQIFLREKLNYKRFKEINADYRTASIEAVHCFALFFPVVEILSSLATAAVVYFGGWLIIGTNGGFTFAHFFLFWFLLGRLFEPIRDLAEKYNILQAAMASSERVFKILDTQPEITTPDKPHAPDGLKGEIEFRNVSFAYTPGENVLEDVSFHVRPGEKIALVGATGGGKTTVASLIMRFYDVTSGEILIDGVDIKRFDQRELRKHFGLVLQDVFMFTGTVLDNIRLSASDIEEERVRTAAGQVSADAFIQKLPEAYHAPVMERGATFSTGERQLLSFARALVFDPRILILDEATSSVDPQTEELIQNALGHLMAGRTSVVIAHRLSTIKKVDRILVVHKGRIHERGTHKELLEKRGIYWNLYNLQYAQQEISQAPDFSPGKHCRSKQK
jgi:ATP-binding cassette subfamily B protein